MQTDKRQGVPWTLVVLFASFLVPAAIAWTLFFTGWRPGSTANHGELLNPPHHLQGQLVDAAGEPVALDSLRGQWTILVRSTGPCDAQCQERLQQTGQVRQALAQHRDRVQRVLVMPPQAPGLAEMAAGQASADEQVGGDLLVYRSSDPLLPADSAQLNAPVHVSLLDSRGFRMLAYPEPFEAGHLLQDMKKLLKISNLDLEQLHGLSGGND